VGSSLYVKVLRARCCSIRISSVCQASIRHRVGRPWPLRPCALASRQATRLSPPACRQGALSRSLW
jgi:hypothetical protein